MWCTTRRGKLIYFLWICSPARCIWHQNCRTYYEKSELFKRGRYVVICEDARDESSEGYHPHGKTYKLNSDFDLETFLMCKGWFDAKVSLFRILLLRLLLLLCLLLSHVSFFTGARPTQGRENDQGNRLQWQVDRDSSQRELLSSDIYSPLKYT